VSPAPLPDGYALGIDDLDEQHGVLFELLANLDQSIQDGDRWVVVHNTLSELLHWTQLHFAVEESVMRICHFPELAKHIEQHKGFVAKVLELKQKSLTEDIADDASKLLHDWLLHHIRIEDRKYSEHFARVSERFAQLS